MSTPTTESPRPYLRTPALSSDGRLLAFVYAADIWLVATEGGPAERLTAHPASHRTPRFAPDGTTIAFSSSRTGAGDIYTLPLTGGEPRRLTYHDSLALVGDWSADGRAIYFTADRERIGPIVYRVDTAGGTPVALYAEPYEHLAHVAVSPDGTTLALNNIRGNWWRRGPNPYAPCDVWLAPSWLQVAGSRLQEPLPRPIPSTVNLQPSNLRGRWPLWAPDGRGLYVVVDEDGVENIWYQPLEGGEARKITDFADGRLLWPAIARRSGLIVFERDCQIWRLDPASGAAEPVPIRVRADTKVTPVRVESWNRGFSELSLAPDGKKVAFVARGAVFADFADKETDREQRQGPSFRVTNTAARESQVVWTPDSRSLIYVSDRHGEDELYRYDFTTRGETRLTHDPAPKFAPRVSPDGAWVAYVRGIDAIYLLNLKSGEARPFAQGSFVYGGSLAWSPDSRWLAYISHDRRFFSNVYVQHIEASEARQITFLSNIMGYDLLWAPNGRFLIFTSGQYRLESQIARVDLRPPAPFFRESEFERLFEGKGQRTEGREAGGQGADQGAESREQRAENKEQRTEGKEPDIEERKPGDDGRESGAEEAKPQAPGSKPQVAEVEIVFEGIERRLRFLTPIQMDARAQAISPDSRDLLFLAAVAGKYNAWSLPLDEPRREQPPRQLTASPSAKGELQFTPDGKAFFSLDDGQIIIRKFPSGNDPVTLQVRGDVTVDFNQEKLHIFGEAWRLLRDSFYDPTFRGQDWDAIRERFAPLAAGAQTAEDLHTIINLMVGELRASHLGSGVSGPGHGSDGYTGLLFDPVELSERGLLRIADVVPDSPAALAESPPRVGEYLLAVDGTPLTPTTNLEQLLQRTVGRRILLRLAPGPAGLPAREVAVRPIDSAVYAELRYRAWVAANESYVHRASGGRLGYVHIPEMSYPAYQQFLADLDAETHGKEGVVLDVRHNGGGHTATFILDVLTRRTMLVSGFRDRVTVDAGHLSGNRVLNKPTVLVTNERSGSNTEMFTESYRRLGLGKVIGKPTSGAVIWTVTYRLLDGAYLRLPRFFIMTPEGEDLEGTGRPVDIDVGRDPGEWATGRDRQLDAAVAALLAQLDGGAAA